MTAAYQSNILYKNSWKLIWKFKKTNTCYLWLGYKKYFWTRFNFNSLLSISCTFISTISSKKFSSTPLRCLTVARPFWYQQYQKGDQNSFLVILICQPDHSVKKWQTRSVYVTSRCWLHRSDKLYALYKCFSFHFLTKAQNNLIFDAINS